MTGVVHPVAKMHADWLDAFNAGDFHGYEGPLFQGLAEIERDWPFVKYFVVLIECLWD
jgi:hypothetical protein